MAKVSVKLDLGNLRERREALERKAADVVAVAAHNIEARGKTLVPFDTGATKNSIKPDFSRNGLQADIGPSTEYAPYLELGTSKMAARPFMVPSLEAEAEPFKAALKALMERG